MPETTTVDTTNTGSVKADWSVLSDFKEDLVQEPVKEEPKVETPESKDNLETTKPEEAKVEDQPEVKAEEKSEEKSEEKVEEKAEDKADQKETTEENPIEFKIDDIKDVPQEYPQGSLRAIAKELGVEGIEETVESFKENFVPKSELEKIKGITVDTIFSNLKPETVTALKLIEQGFSEESVFAPTKEIEGYLALDDSSIVRADLELKGYNTEYIDTELELLTEKGLISHEAQKLRIGLNQTKQEIIDKRTQLLEQYEQQKQNAILHQKEEEKTQFTKSLDNVSEFMGVPVSEDVKEILLKKYNNGKYENILNNADIKVKAILYEELGEKLAKHIQNKASETAKREITKKLSNVPPVTGGAGKRVEPEKENIDNPWAILKELG